MSSHSQADRRRPRDLRPARIRALLGALAVAIVGGAVALGIAAAAGLLHTGSPSTTTVERVPASPPSPSALAGPWSAIYRAAAPGTVAITVSSTRTLPTPYGEREAQATAEGTGVVLDGRGDILTAAHVVTGARSVTVTFSDGTRRGASVLGTDDSTDAAVVKVDPAGLTLRPLALGSSRALAVGDPLAVIGTALGFEESMSTGVVSGLDRTIEAPNGFTIPYALQTDSAMNPGNSGGPVLDSRGEVVGIADQIATGTDEFGRSSTATSSGVGFAVPIDLVKAEIPELENGKRVGHAYLGVEMAATSEAGQTGATVRRVLAGTPAASAGLRAGDKITALNGTAIASAGDLTALLAGMHPGERITLTVVRGGHTMTLTVTLGKQPAHAPSP